MKFKRTEQKAIIGQERVTYEEEGTDFKIQASRSGLQFFGTSSVISDNQELDDFAKVVSDAQRDRIQFIFPDKKDTAPHQ